MVILVWLLMMLMSGVLPLPLVLVFMFMGSILGFALFIPVQSSVFDSF